MAELEEVGGKGATIKIMPDMKPLVDVPSIEMFDSITIKYKGVVITISDTAEKDGLLEGLATEEALLICADIVRQYAGDGSLEETIDAQTAIRETLQLNYGWTDIEFNAFVRVWRRNLHLMKIGSQNQSEFSLKEFKRLVEFIDKKEAVAAGEMSLGDSSTTIEEDIQTSEENK